MRNKSIFIGVMLFSSSLSAYAVDGHNGITFKMSQKQIEVKGFVCNSEKDRKNIIAVCNHMEMTGTAFGVPTENYEVSIGSNKRVDEIRMQLVGFTANIENYIDLTLKVNKFFPNKDETLSFSKDGYFVKDFYRSKDKSGISVFFTNPIPPISKGMKSITFYSPRSMEFTDKAAVNKAKEAMSGSESTESLEQSTQ